MNFNPITPSTQGIFKQYESLRPIYMSEGHFLNQYIWEDYYHTRFATDELALYLLIDNGKKPGFFAPLCKEEHIPEVFRRMESYSHEILQNPLRIYLADKPLVRHLQKSACLTEKYSITEDRDCFDYIYDADRLRTLSGKIMHKKKNLLNKFLKEYEGHFQYETLGPEHVSEIKTFHQKWLDERRVYDKYGCIDDEEEGIYRLFEHYDSLRYKMGGVRIDGKLKAYTIGSYIPDIQCAFIHIEKADVNYTGLYNYINQQFILHEFPDAKIVNREDDLGQENLRQAKLSYRPIRLEEKFTIRETCPRTL